MMTKYTTTCRRLWVASSITLAILCPPLSAETSSKAARPVSPGLTDQVTTVDSKCPTFSWTADPDAEAYELVVFELPDAAGIEHADEQELDPSMVVLLEQIERGAQSWTPPLDKCLAPGSSHVWFVRSVRSESGQPFKWSAAARFRVAATPSLAEISAALETLKLTSAAESSSSQSASIPPGPSDDARSSSPGSGGPGGGLAGAVAAIRGEIPDTTGQVFGVVGTSASAQGAGIAAAGAFGGADVHLDGATDGEESARLSQSALDRPSPTPTSFDVRNSGGGGIALTVDGETVVTTSTDSDLLATLGCGAGQVALAAGGGEWGCAGGPGSGLDADLLDGLEASAFAGASHAHDDLYYRESELSTPAGAQIVHWSRLLAVPADIADGDDDSFAAVVCTEDQVLRWIGGNWVCTPERPQRPLVPRANQTLPIAETGSFSSITVGVDGMPIISYFEVESQSLRVAHCLDLDCAAFDTYLIDATASVGEHNSITIGSDGLPVISYYDSTNADLKVARCLAPDCSSVSVVTADPLGDTGEFTSIAIRANGLPIVSYYDETLSSLLALACSDLGCATGSIGFLGAGGTGSSIALGADGRPVVSYIDATQNVQLARCNTDCSVASSTLLIRGYGPTSLAIGADGLPIISFNWGLFPLNQLGTFKCTWPDCSANAGGGFETGNNAKSAVTIGADGLPIIAYYDHATTQIDVGHCATADCGSWSSIVMLDTVSPITTSLSPSITIGSDGLPLVVHARSESGPLMLTRCANTFCSPYQQGR